MGNDRQKIGEAGRTKIGQKGDERMCTCRLRELERRDLAAVNSWRNDSELIACLEAPFRFINPEVDERWFENYMQNRGTAIRCAIVTEAGDGIAGLVSLTGIDRQNQSAEFHIMIGKPENRGQGIGLAATMAMLEHGFYHMNLQRIESHILKSNVRSQRMHEKAGFVCEGIRRCAVYKSGTFEDVKLYAVLREEYKSL